MIEELIAKNLLSFRDEMCLSFEATNDTMGEDQLVMTMPDGKRLLRFGMIYGANASGKSNVLFILNSLIDNRTTRRQININCKRNTMRNIISISIAFFTCKTCFFAIIIFIESSKNFFGLSFKIDSIINISSIGFKA
jgi:AAA15 family ATPase/GTPase